MKKQLMYNRIVDKEDIVIFQDTKWLKIAETSDNLEQVNLLFTIDSIKIKSICASRVLI